MIFYLHGIQSHGGWFEWSASALAATGRPVILPDRRGSGLNSAARGDMPSYARLLDDLDELAGWAGREFGPLPLAVVGVSWGGKLAVAWALRRPDHVVRVLLVAPGLFPAVDVGFLNRLRIGVSLLRQPVRDFPIPLDDPALFTDDPDGQRFIAEDPLKLSTATARFFYESARLDQHLTRAARGSLAAETTLVLAERDRIIRNRPTRAWLDRLTDGAAAVETLAGAHTLEFERDTRGLQGLLEAWAAGSSSKARTSATRDCADGISPYNALRRKRDARGTEQSAG
ncbi:MAG: alpha/beta fold hydrolase [Planctomycetota bacterium]